MPPATEIDHLSNIGDDVNYLFLGVENRSFLWKITEAYGLTDVESPAVGLLEP